MADFGHVASFCAFHLWLINRGRVLSEAFLQPWAMQPILGVGVLQTAILDARDTAETLRFGSRGLLGDEIAVGIGCWSYADGLFRLIRLVLCSCWGCAWTKLRLRHTAGATAGEYLLIPQPPVVAFKSLHA